MSFVIFKISGIKCINCKIRIENHLMDFEGIKKLMSTGKKLWQLLNMMKI